MQLRRRSFTGRIVDLPEAHKLPTVVTSNTETFEPRAHIEVRSGLGRIDWYAWLDGDVIAPADSPVVAADLIVEALS